MSLRAPLICLLHCLLVLLFVVPLACAAVAEKTLPDPAVYAAAPCPPSSTVYGNGSAGNAVAGPSIEEVWMQHGGARNYYSAQYSARQQYMGGATRIDPACLPLLPPMKAWGAPATKKVSKVSKSRKVAPAANPCPEVDKATGAALSKNTPKVDSKASSQANTTDAATKANAAVSAVSPKGANGQGSPAAATALKVSPPAAGAVKAATAEKTPIH